MAAILLRAARASRSLALPRSMGASPSPLSSSAASTAETPFPAAETPGIAAGVDDAVIVLGEEDDLRGRVFRLRLAKRSATEALDKWAGEGRAGPAPELRRIARDLSPRVGQPSHGAAAAAAPQRAAPYHHVTAAPSSPAAPAPAPSSSSTSIVQ